MVDRKTYQVLKKYWGYDTFRQPQEDIIDHVLSGKDAIVLLPTGGGKSLCYQLPALLLDGLTLVISPLISLMEDQVRQLEKRGIKAALIHSGVHYSQRKRILNDVVSHRYDLLYMAPERLETSDIMDYLASAKLRLVAMDEAHCISQWGHDFRPSYLNVGLIRQHFPSIPVLALTGTATTDILKDIGDILSLSNPRIFRAGFERENIELLVLEEDNKLAQALHLLKSSPGSSIIYVRSRRGCVELANWLVQRGISSRPYHAGMEVSDRQEVQNAWIEDRIDCIVATSAFGMGVDKPDVRLVIHYELPPSIEDYYQEIGRAGRDGQPSRAVMMTHGRDRQNLIKRYLERSIQKDDLREVYRLIANYLDASPESFNQEFQSFEPAAFAEYYKLDKALVREALSWLQERGYLEFRSGQVLQSRVHIKMSKALLLDYIKQDQRGGPLLQAMLRAYEGLLSVPAPVDEAKLSTMVDMSPDEVVTALDLLARRDVIEYIGATTGKALRIRGVREWSHRLDLDYQQFATNIRRKKERAEAVLEYLDLSHCRTKWLLKYFDEEKHEDCGHCDICLGSLNTEASAGEKAEVRQRILDMLEVEKLYLPEILRAFPIVKRKIIMAVVREMLEENELVVKDATFTLPRHA